MRSRSKPLTSARQISLLFVVVVIVGYIATFIMRSGQDSGELTPQELLWAIVFGVVYLLVGLNEGVISGRLPAGWAEGLFFSMQCSLVFGIGWMLGTGGTWLIGVPLVGFAVEMLPPRQRWVVYVALIASVVLPHGLRHATWISALFSSVTVGTAIFFSFLWPSLRRCARTNSRPGNVRSS